MSLILLVTLFAYLTINPPQEEQYNFTITVTSEEDGGIMMIALAADKESFLEESIAAEAVPFVSDKVTVTFTLPPGEYGVSVFHDLNGNEELDTNLLGIPNEPYGFGNDARGTFGPASFDDSKVILDKDKSMTIRAY